MDPQNTYPNAPQNPSPSGNRTVLQLPEGPLRISLEQPKSFWSRLGGRFMWAVLAILLMVIIGQRAAYQEYYHTPDEEIKEKYHSLSKQDSADKIAIISVEGTIMSGDGFVKKQIDRVTKDEKVKAVVLRVNSPGGTVTGSDYIYHHLKKMLAEKKIPMVVSMGSLAASGGYYVSMAAGDGEKLIYAEPTTWTGSIGVIIPHYNVSGLLEKWDIVDDSTASGPLKQMLSPTRKVGDPLKAQEEAVIKNLVDESFSEFKQIVLNSRTALKNDPEKQKTAFTGQIFTAKQAKENLLIDEIGFIESAIERAAQLANLSTDKVRVVEYKQPLGALSELLGANASHSSARLDVSQLLDLTAPRAYFLCTWLPSMISQSK